MSELHQWAQIAQNASVIVAALVAIFGIDAWRREYVGKRHMELAEEVLALFYQARDAIRAIRNSVGYLGEGQTRNSDPNESPEQKRALDNAYVAIERYNKHVEIFSRLHALRYRFMAQVGKAESSPFDDLDQVLNKIFLAASRLSRYWTGGDEQFHSEADKDRFYANIRQSEAIFWSGDDPDLIDVKVEELVGEIESTCRAILTSKGTLFHLINLPLWNSGRV